MPVHPCGNFKYNSAIKILEREHGKNDLKTVHWLDVQTSGILFFAKTSEAAAEFEDELRADRVHKTYIAWVIGDMTKLGDTIDCKDPIYQITPFYFSTNKGDKDEDFKEGGQPVPWTMKEARTVFTVMFYDEQSNTTVVSCWLYTGRTHQIWVHLKGLGHPIANDPNYGGILHNGFSIPEESKEEPIWKEETQYHQDPGYPDWESMRFWLHAFKYKYKEKTIETPLPEWAKPEYKIKNKFS